MGARLANVTFFRPYRAWRFICDVNPGRRSRTRFALGYHRSGFQPCFGDGSDRLALLLNGGLRDCELNFGSGFRKQSHPCAVDRVAGALLRAEHFQASRGRRTGTPAESSGRISRRRFSANLGSLSTLRHYPQSFAGPEPREGMGDFSTEIWRTRRARLATNERN